MKSNIWQSDYLHTATNHAWNPHFTAFGIQTAYNRPGPVYRAGMTSRNAFAATNSYTRPPQRKLPPQAMFSRIANSRQQQGRLPSAAGGVRSAQRHFQGSAAPAAFKPPVGPRPSQLPGGEAPDARMLD